MTLCASPRIPGRVRVPGRLPRAPRDSFGRRGGHLPRVTLQPSVTLSAAAGPTHLPFLPPAASYTATNPPSRLLSAQCVHQPHPRRQCPPRLSLASSVVVSPVHPLPLRPHLHIAAGAATFTGSNNLKGGRMASSAVANANHEYNSMLTNMKFHNLCTELKTPPKMGRLLGLNLPFCLESSLSDQYIAKTMKKEDTSV